MVLVGKRAACQPDLHDIVVEIRDLGPCLADRATEDAWMIISGELGIAVIINHDAVVAPQHDHRNRRMNDEGDKRAQALRPEGDRTERRGAPVIIRNPLTHFSSIFEEEDIFGFGSQRAQHMFAPLFVDSETTGGKIGFHKRQIARPLHPVHDARVLRQ
ncbi:MULTISPECIES: hypothetical protein [unclassified Sphingopyxis]|uniref:hypothetical protein n=1 Tax=unclassified Sphingopyxis TaxID=2614943 RepID=UPI0019111FBE|nr:MULTISPECIES: hypothetical protein [unclassified Sphingopyxis]